MNVPARPKPDMMRVTRDGVGTQTWDVLVAMTRLDRARQLSDTRADLGMAQRRLLWLLLDGERHTMRDVAERMLLEQSTVNRQVNAAIAAGLIERVKVEGEAAHSLAVTAAGQAAFTADLERNSRLHQAALAVLPADKVDEFLELLMTFASAYRDIIEDEVVGPDS